MVPLLSYAPDDPLGLWNYEEWVGGFKLGGQVDYLCQGNTISYASPAVPPAALCTRGVVVQRDTAVLGEVHAYLILEHCLNDKGRTYRRHMLDH